MTKELNEKVFFIIKKEAWTWGTQYTIHDHKQYDLTTAVRKLLALDELNEDKKQISFHLQEVNFSMVGFLHLLVGWDSLLVQFSACS